MPHNAHVSQRGENARLRRRIGGLGGAVLVLMLAACGTLPATSHQAVSAPPVTTGAPASAGPVTSGAPASAGPSTTVAPTTAAPTTVVPAAAAPAPASRPAVGPTTTGSPTTGPTTAGPTATGPTTTGPTTTARSAASSGPPSTTVPKAPTLHLGVSGPAVLSLQQRLTGLGYWLGSPDGVFGDSTEQAVFAYQKAAGLTPDGVVGPRTTAALASGAVPHPRSTSGYVIEVNLADDLMLFVNNGKVQHILNTSTGGGYVYSSGGETAVANTPVGTFSIFRQVNGMVTDSLGQLWRPKFFYSGFAIHGDGYVPPYPVSHGCARVSNEAINWIWADNLAPIGTEVWVY